MKKSLRILALAAATCGIAHVSSGQTTYTWNGGTDLDWDNAANWAGNSVPVDHLTSGNYSDGLNFQNNSNDIIVFAGSTAPTTNVPGLGGGFNPTSDTPRLSVKSGGTFNFTISAREDGTWSTSADAARTIWTIGDGIGGGTEDVDVSISNLKWINRNDQNTTTDILVNSDATLRLDTDLYFSNTSARPGSITIAGGEVIVSAKLMDLGQQASDFVNFTMVGSSFTANYGAGSGLMQDIEDVSDTYASVWQNNFGGTFEFTDLGTGFTVTAVPEPGTYALLAGLTGLAYVMTRRRQRS